MCETERDIRAQVPHSKAGREALRIQAEMTEAGGAGTSEACRGEARRVVRDAAVDLFDEPEGGRGRGRRPAED